MARAGSAWSVKGIDEETRAIARSRAGNSDLTIGAWIDRAILDYSSVSRSELPGEVGQQPTPMSVESETRGEPALATEDILDLIDKELEASRSRLDGALRPVGYALKDLALRLVAAEALERGGTPRLRDTDTERNVPAAPTARHGKPLAGTDLPPAPLGSLAPEITDNEIPSPQINPSSGEVATEIPPSAPTRPFPSAPIHNLNAAITGMEPPITVPAEGSPKVGPEADHPSNAEGVFVSQTSHRPLPVPPTDSLSTVDPADLPSPADLEKLTARPIEANPREALYPTPPPEPPRPVDENNARSVQEVHFTGIQGGFETNPALASSEARRTNWRQTRRIAAGIVPFLIVGSVAAGYIFAEPLGLLPVRTQLVDKLGKHAQQARLTIADAYSEGRGFLGDLIAGLEESDDAKPPVMVVDRQATPKTLGRDVPSPPVTESDSPDKIDQEPRRVAEADILKPDDPEVANLSTAPASEQPTLSSEKTRKPQPLARPKLASPIIKPKLATPPPLPPVIPGPVSSEPIKQPNPTTRLAALPTAPTIKQASIPPSGTNRNVSMAALTSAARAGDPRSQLELARRYIQGDGIEQNYAEGSEWFREAAIQGVASAQYNLAVLYERGLGVTKDDVRAFLWYHSAAEQSHPLAQYNLGNFYLQGRGIPLSYGEAVRWFRAASRQGVSKATYNLAVLTEDGLGVPPDKNKALALYKQAADAGHHEAESRLALLRSSTGVKAKPATFAETANTQTDELSTGTTVAAIQAVLRGAGVYDGRIDGIAGPKTRTAIREYQKRQDLPITGIPSENLLNHMKAAGESKPLSG